MATAANQAHDVPASGDIRRKLIRGGIVIGVRVLAAAGIQLVGIAGAAVFVQAVYAELPKRLSWWQGWAQQGANAVLPTAGSTAVGYWTVSSVGWGAKRFAERAAVMIVAPAAPNLVLVAVVGLGMGLGLFAGPSDWWLTFLPAAIAI